VSQVVVLYKLKLAVFGLDTIVHAPAVQVYAFLFSQEPNFEDEVEIFSEEVEPSLVQ